jgi:hypothetical protein
MVIVGYLLANVVKFFQIAGGAAFGVFFSLANVASLPV